MESYFKNTFDIFEIGEGSFGNVYKATNKIDKLSYAIKQISVDNFKNECKKKSQFDEWKQRLEKEVLNLVKVQSKFIVQYHSCWYEPATLDEDDDPTSDLTSTQRIITRQYFYIKMELCSSDLSKWLVSNPQRKLQQIYSIFLQYMKGLAFIHNRGMIHRDLKPANILLQDDGTNTGCVKIADLGLSTLIDEQNKADLTKRIGTLIYMSPEMLYQNDYSSNTDMYSSGLILFESTHVFNSHKKRNAAFFDIQNGSYKFPNALPANDIIKRLTSLKPEERPSANEVIELLKRELEGVKLSNSNGEGGKEDIVGDIDDLPHSTTGEKSSIQSFISDLEHSQSSLTTHNGHGVKRKLELDTVKAHEVAKKMENCSSLLANKRKLQGILGINEGDFNQLFGRFQENNNYDFVYRLIGFWISPLGKAAEVGKLRNAFKDNGLVGAADLLDKYDETAEAKLHIHELARDLENSPDLLDNKRKVQGILGIKYGDFKSLFNDYNNNNYEFFIGLVQLWISGLGNEALVGKLRRLFEKNELVDAADLLNEFDNEARVVSS